jgi:SH3-like domain-containing protein
MVVYPNRIWLKLRALPLFLSLLVVIIGSSILGCSRFRPKPAVEYVYVSAKGTFLRDRLAAVSNRVAEVSNGQRLQVIERARRFVRVKTEKGEIGWIDEHAVITQQVYDQFIELGTKHAHDAVIATAVLRDDSYLHDAPGRQTDHYYLLPENDKLQLLVRASVPKPMPPQGFPGAAPAASHTTGKAAAKSGASGSKGKGKQAEEASLAPQTPPLQDWWLVRDSDGHAGWIWSHMIDIDVPAEIGGLSEGQRFVGAYVLRTVDDPESNFPDKRAPEYVVVLNAWKDGLPYDFDQVRVFTWNTRKHRYETAYRQRNLEAYLPVVISNRTFGGQQEPVFSFKVAAGEDVAIDPQTGAAHPAQTEDESFRLEGALVKKVEANAPPAPAPATPKSTTTGPPKESKHHKKAASHKSHHKSAAQ